MKTNNQIFPMIFLVIFLMLSIGFNHIPAAYSQNQSSSFQAESYMICLLKKSKVGDKAIE
jgi:hypothetical protein